ncbi:MAG: hypothetical protein ACI8W3_002194 [Myxococcota bacterium]|jgi:uncharacterized protein YdbL (DUF1318 family)
MFASQKGDTMNRMTINPSTIGKRLRTAVLGACLFALLLGAPLAASAEYLLGTAKASGAVGEGTDGYLGLIDQNASDQIKKMVKDTNMRRANRYGDIASKRGSTKEVVAKQAAAKLIKRAAAGEMVETADGKWKKK